MAGVKRSASDELEMPKALLSKKSRSKPRYVPRAIPGARVVSVCKTVDRGIHTASNSATFGSLQFTMDDFNDTATYVAAFDQFRFKKVIFRMIPLSKSGVAPSSTGGIVQPFERPCYYVCFDYDDAATPTSAAIVQNDSTCRVYGPDDVCIRSIVPRNATATYAGAFTGYGVGSPKTWMNTSSSTTPFYGVKWAVDAAQAATAQYPRWRIVCTYYMEFTSPN